MHYGNRKKFLGLLLTAVLTLTAGTAYPVLADDKAEQQQQLQQQLQAIQEQIQAYQQQLSQVQAQKNTLANKIKQLQNQQATLSLQIQASNLQIADLGSQITGTQGQIANNADRQQTLQAEISEVIRQINENDQQPFLYTVISQQQLSDVFTAYQNLSQVSQDLSQLSAELQQTNQQLAQFQQQLQQQQQDTENLLSIKVLQQTDLAGSVDQQNQLLKATKGKEADYQIVISDSQKQAAAIRSRLYELLGVSSQITFGQALQIAQWAQGATGIDPAFLLAVLTQESNLGQNVGTCNRPGDPPAKSWKVVMKPDRDQQPFLQITQSLGLDPDVTPVSCPMHDSKGNQVGWGGAMGPAQFIPSTWMGYKDKVSQLTGNNPSNPWDIRDAFAAAAIKLVAGGADGSQQGEWNAAMRYFSGGTSSKYSFYGDSVMSLTAKYQTDINNLNN
ncbi:MAG TPA: hypothetical protein VHA30_05215 [Patescibacteria group bacterium]|nr:hypothetical protein [Patescibacteria group bacterium]